MKKIKINNESDNPIKVATSKQGFVLVQKLKATLGSISLFINYFGRSR